MTDQFVGNETIRTSYGLTVGKTFEEEFSVASIESIIFYSVAFCAWLLESVFDLFTTDVKAYIDNMKPHTTKWMVNMALAYQHGFSLLADSDKFNNTGKTADQVSASKIVSYAACTEQLNQYGRPYLRLKAAKNAGPDLGPLAAAELSGLTEYVKKVKDAGVMIQVESLPADSLKMSWEVYYDPLLIDANGNRLDGTGNDVARVAIKEFLTKLPFNGIYALQKHEDYVQTVPGILLCHIFYAQTKYGAIPWADVNVLATPDSGYIRFVSDADLLIQYIPQSEVV